MSLFLNLNLNNDLLALVDINIILLGRESKGVPEYIHKKLKNKLKIPMTYKVRSLNVAITASISAAEALRQIKKF